MTDRTDEIRQRCDAATPGPWGRTGAKQHIICQSKDEKSHASKYIGEIWSRSDDAQFIAHARDDIPYLLGEIDRLREYRMANEQATISKLVKERNSERERCSNMTARAEQAERERDACKADFEACMRGNMERCAYCIHDDECEPGESLCYANVCGFEWRGLQEAGKSEEE